MGSTTKELVADLRTKPYSLKREYVLQRALKGVYHDYDSELATPKVTAYMDLLEAGFRDLAEKVKDGAYDDEQPTVEQLEEMRQQLGPKVFDAVMGERERGKA